MNSINLISKLEDICIERYLDEINFKLDDDTSNDLYLCDVLIEHLAKGDLNDVYESDLIDGFKLEDQKKLLDVVSKNCDICFVNNSSEYWLDSISYIEVEDYKFAVKKILDNFEFLLKVLLRCGEDKLKLLSSLKDDKIHVNQSIIDSIRENFEDDEQIINLLNSNLPDLTIKNKLKKIMSEDIVYLDDYQNMY